MTATSGQSSDHDTNFAAPSGPKISRELASVIQVPRLARRTPSLLGLPKGNSSVMVFPGWQTSDAFMAPLRSGLRVLGHRTYGWGFGVNRGEVEGLLPSVANSIAHHVHRDGKPLCLVGWSLGGVFAREIARDYPDLVEQVITLATPVFGGPKYTRGARTYSQDYLDDLDRKVEARNKIPIERPITAIYSQADAIVDWRACIDTFSPMVNNVEVSSTHVGVTIDPDVWEIVAVELASSLRGT